MGTRNKSLKNKKTATSKKGFFSFFSNFLSFSKQNITLMIVPHVEGKIFNLRLPVLALLVGGISLLTLIIGVFVFSVGYRGTKELLAQNNQQYEEAQSNLLLFRDKMEEVNKVIKEFRISLDNTVSKVGIPVSVEQEGALGIGDFGYFGELSISDENSLQEIETLEKLRTDLSQAIAPLEGLGEALRNQKDLFQDVPTLWPIKGGIGIKTLGFGPAPEPFTKKWYIHRGLDLYARPGTPIVSTANGVVIKTAYDPHGFGNHVIIKHKYGFSTVYAHMTSIAVMKGQKVNRGDVVGTLGATGYATGPHLHYEVRIGSQVVDPEVYLNISASIGEK